MSEQTQDGNEAGETSTGDFTPITSQEDFDKAIAARIERAKRSALSEVGDVDELRAKAAKWDEAEQANQSEAERLQAELDAAKAAADQATRDALRLRVAAKHGVSDEDADLFLTGSDEETLTRQAQRLAEAVDQRTSNGNVVPGEGTTKTPPDDPERKFVRDLFNPGD